MARRFALELLGASRGPLLIRTVVYQAEPTLAMPVVICLAAVGCGLVGFASDVIAEGIVCETVAESETGLPDSLPRQSR